MQLLSTLMRFFDYIMHKVHKGRAEYGEPTESWAHCEREPEGYFEIPENRPTPIDKIVRLVDTYIREVIVALNRSGFVTIESCSGLKQDHQGKTSIEPYVCFDDEYYLDVSAHLFTLASASGWDPTFGAHGFDVLFYTDAEGDKEIKRAWGRLEDMAGEFGEYLEEYRDLVEPREGYYYYWFRRERCLFSRCYSEESRTLLGFIDELKKIENEFRSDVEE